MSPISSDTVCRRLESAQSSRMIHPIVWRLGEFAVLCHLLMFKSQF